MEEKKLRFGFTTGSCAAAASKAALFMLLSGKEINSVTIMTPKEIPYHAEIIDINKDPQKGLVSCAVRKDGGDDPDVTTGYKIYASVSLKDTPGIDIDGGEGVGRITKPGMDQPIGNAAINSVPRKMITENLEETLKDFHLTDKGASVIISVPGGEELAQKTFNPKLGITGGISILGTTGIVEPMSDAAITSTIRVEAKIRRAEGKDILMAAPGNYGLNFLKEVYGIDEKNVVMSSNFVFDTVQIAANEGFSKMLFAGHIGKLIKVAGGIKNTHSKFGDHRMEILSDLAKKCLDSDTYLQIKDKIEACVMTDEAVKIINGTGQGEKVFKKIAANIKTNMEGWSLGKLRVEVIVFSNENTELVATRKAHEWIKEV